MPQLFVVPVECHYFVPAVLLTFNLFLSFIYFIISVSVR